MAGERWRRRNTERRGVKPFRGRTRGREGTREWRGLHFTVVYWQRRSQALVNKSPYSNGGRNASVCRIRRFCAVKAQAQSSLLLNVLCSGHLVPLHTVQSLWKVSLLARALGCSASVQTNNTACAREIITVVKILSPSINASITLNSIFHWYRWLVSLYNIKKTCPGGV